MPDRAQQTNRIASLKELNKELTAGADPDRARNLAGFFKTAKGQYGHGDRFIGVTVPVQRQIARRYPHLSLDEIATLLESRIHERRFTALEILVDRYERGDAKTKRAVFDFYLKNTARINNWIWSILPLRTLSGTTSFRAGVTSLFIWPSPPTSGNAASRSWPRRRSSGKAI